MNNENLKVPTSEEARANGRKGGLASGEARRQRKSLKEELTLLLEEGDTQKNMTVALLVKALDGDIRAFEVIRDTIGEKPKDVLDITQNDIKIKIDDD